MSAAPEEDVVANVNANDIKQSVEQAMGGKKLSEKVELPSNKEVIVNGNGFAEGMNLELKLPEPKKGDITAEDKNPEKQPKLGEHRGVAEKLLERSGHGAFADNYKAINQALELSKGPDGKCTNDKLRVMANSYDRRAASKLGLKPHEFNSLSPSNKAQNDKIAQQALASHLEMRNDPRLNKMKPEDAAAAMNKSSREHDKKAPQMKISFKIDKPLLFKHNREKALENMARKSEPVDDSKDLERVRNETGHPLISKANPANNQGVTMKRKPEFAGMIGAPSPFKDKIG